MVEAITAAHSARTVISGVLGDFAGPPNVMQHLFAACRPHRSRLSPDVGVCELFVVGPDGADYRLVARSLEGVLRGRRLLLATFAWAPRTIDHLLTLWRPQRSAASSDFIPVAP